MKTIRLGTGTAFWGDMLDGAFTAVEKGDISYLCSDHLAELTLCILQKLKRRNPEEGYTRDLIPLMQRILPTCVEKGIKVIDQPSLYLAQGEKDMEKTAYQIAL